MAALGKTVYRFSEFELEPQERRLSMGGRPIALTPKVFDTLVFLVERAGHMVTKQELLKAIWPRGFVDESNLTKHIWLIRRALGDGDQPHSQFIETVPKVGYRFVAKVTAAEVAQQDQAVVKSEVASLDGIPVEGGSPAAAAIRLATAAGAEGANSAATGFRWRWAGVGLAVLILAASGFYLLRKPAPLTMDQTGRSVALVSFNNLSANPKDAWLAPALKEMLGAELNIASDVRVIPDELVRDGSADLSPPAAGGYSRQTLDNLQRRLDADYVVSGSYVVGGSTEDPPLRVDVSVQDARTGALVASISKQSALSGLLTLVSGEGAALRSKLSARTTEADALNRIPNAQPPSVDVARRLGFALDALRHYDAARARDELLEIVAEAPGYAPAYSYLAEAWTALGYREKALAAAEQAAQHGANLPAEQRLRIEAVLNSAHANWSKALEARRQLSQLKPMDLDYRLSLVDAQIAAGTIAAAPQVLRDLAGLPGGSADPRVELAAAHAASFLNDPKGAEVYAGKALQKALARDAAGLVADARVALGGAQLHINKNEEARGQFLAAIDAYRSIRNPRGEAAARSDLAAALANLNRNEEAREEYQRAMSLEQSVGDLEGEAAIYRQLCGMLWLAGDRDGAQTAARHGLELAREIGDLSTQAWTIQALATIEADDTASDEVIGEYREVVALSERAGHPSVWPMANIADIQRMRGELDSAAATCEKARAQATTLSDPQFAIFSGFTCALIEMDRGNAAAARAGFEEVIRLVGTGGDTTYRDNSRMMLAQLDMDERRWNAARTRLEQAGQGFAASEGRTGEADSSALLALTERALGDSDASERSIERALRLRASITAHQEVYVVDIALAALGPSSLGTQAQIDKLLALSDDAARRNFIGWSLEAKLAAWELLADRRSSKANALRDEIETIARRHGFGRVLRRLKLDQARSNAHS